MSNSGTSNRKEKCFSLWLGIAAAECPPNHYRLLDLPLFEDSPEQIRLAAHRRLAQISAYNSADDVADAAALRNYIAKVSAGLLDPRQKRFYDEELRKRISTPIVHEAHPAPPPHVAAAADRQQLHRLAPGINGSQENGTVNGSVENPAEVAVPAQPTVTVPVLGAESPQPIPSGKGSVWPWVAGIATLNAVVLAGITVALLWHQSQPVTVPNQLAAEPRRDRTPVAEPSAPAPTTVATALPLVPKPDVLPKIAAPAERPAKTKKAETAQEDSESDSKVAKDEDEKSEPTKHKLLSPKKKKKSDNPFEDIEKEFTLPAMPSGIKTPSDLVSLGTIDPSKIDGVSLELDAQAADLETRCALKLERQKIGDKLSRLWQILVSVKDSPDISLGQFQIEPNGNLAFGWRLSESYPKAGQLRNSVLVLQHGTLRKEVPLRKAINAPCGTFDFSKAKIAIPFQIDDLPKDQLLTITFKELKGIKKPDLLNTNTPLTRHDGRDGVIEKLISDANGISVRGEFTKDPKDGGVSLVMFPRYVEGIKSPPLTVEGFNASVRRLTGDIHDNAAAYVFAIGRLPELRRQIEINIGDQQGLDVRDPAQSQRLGQLKASLTKMRLEEKNLVATLRRHRKNLPKNYRALSAMMSTGQLANNLQANGRLEFDVISRSDTRDIVLLRANGQPPEQVVQRAFQIPKNPPLEGSWINFEDEVLCELNVGGSFQVKSLANPVAKHGGTWRRNDDDVELSNGQRTLQYKAIYNIELQNETSGSLFKVF